MPSPVVMAAARISDSRTLDRRRVGLVEAERLEVGADRRDVPADDDVQLVAEPDDLARRGARRRSPGRQRRGDVGVLEAWRRRRSNCRRTRSGSPARRSASSEARAASASAGSDRRSRSTPWALRWEVLIAVSTRSRTTFERVSPYVVVARNTDSTSEPSVKISRMRRRSPSAAGRERLTRRRNQPPSFTSGAGTRVRAR